MISLEILNPIIKKHNILIKRIDSTNLYRHRNMLMDTIVISTKDMTIEKANEILLDISELDSKVVSHITTEMDYDSNIFKVDVFYDKKHRQTELEKELESYKMKYNEISENKLVKLLRWLLLVK